MGADLSHLKITKAPKAFAALAQRHNQLVDLVSSIEGALGIDIAIASSPHKPAQFPHGMKAPKQQPRGKILVSMTTPVWAAGVGTSAGNTAQAVSANGALIDVLQPVSPNAVANFPTRLATNGATNYFDANANGVTIMGATNSISIPYANIAKPMTIRTVTVCDNGNSKSMDIIASATY